MTRPPAASPRTRRRTPPSARSVTATDPDTNNTNFNTLTYSLTGTNASDFSIDSSTGQIKVKSALNYEAKTSYSVTVNVTDGKNGSGTADTTADDTIAVTINVTDVNEPPGKPAAPTVTVDSTTPNSKLNASWSAPDMTGKPAISDYDVQYPQGGRFHLDGCLLHRHWNHRCLYQSDLGQDLRGAGAGHQ